MTRTLREQVLAPLPTRRTGQSGLAASVAEKVDAAGGFADSMLEQAAWIAGCRLTPEERQAAQTLLAQLPAAVAEAPRIQPAAPGLRRPRRAMARLLVVARDVGVLVASGRCGSGGPPDSQQPRLSLPGR